MIWARFLTGLGWISVVLETRGRSGCSGSRFFSTCEANFWILDAPVATFGRHIIDLGGRRGAPGGFGRLFWLRFGVKDCDDHQNHWNSGIYALACMGAWFSNGLSMLLGWFLMVWG